MGVAEFDHPLRQGVLQAFEGNGGCRCHRPDVPGARGRRAPVVDGAVVAMAALQPLPRATAFLRDVGFFERLEKGGAAAVLLRLKVPEHVRRLLLPAVRVNDRLDDHPLLRGGRRVLGMAVLLVVGVVVAGAVDPAPGLERALLGAHELGLVDHAAGLLVLLPPRVALDRLPVRRPHGQRPVVDVRASPHAATVDGLQVELLLRDVV
mmetsp:Transcript_15129/g.38397  ORF Transcript_15129/g.38397 Transcript_15129/m.38397 type:complete len:207 (+) Transcript_15129:190-810(+)